MQLISKLLLTLILNFCNTTNKLLLNIYKLNQWLHTTAPKHLALVIQHECDEDEHLIYYFLDPSRDTTWQSQPNNQIERWRCIVNNLQFCQNKKPSTEITEVKLKLLAESQLGRICFLFEVRTGNIKLVPKKTLPFPRQGFSCFCCLQSVNW